MNTFELKHLKNVRKFLFFEFPLTFDSVLNNGVHPAADNCSSLLSNASDLLIGKVGGYCWIYILDL